MGPELLARHQLVGIIDTLPDLYSAWEEWAAAVAESHTTYPVMLMFRSPEPWFSWLLALLAVLDGAAMHLALAPATASSNARLCLRMGFTCLDRIGSMLGWHLDPDPLPEAPIALTFGEFEAAVKMLEEIGFPVERSAEEAWPDFHGWRVNYEAVAYRLADKLVVPPAPWSGTRRHLRPGITEPDHPLSAALRAVLRPSPHEAPRGSEETSAPPTFPRIGDGARSVARRVARGRRDIRRRDIRRCRPSGPRESDPLDIARAGPRRPSTAPHRTSSVPHQISTPTSGVLQHDYRLDPVSTTTYPWEFYNTATTDWTQSNDLSKDNPAKLAEMQRLFLIESTKATTRHNVLGHPFRLRRGYPRSAPRAQ